MTNKAKILITGDFCPIKRISEFIMQERYEAIFNDFLPVINDNDLAITNLECPLTDLEDKINKTGPSLKASINAAKLLSLSGFKLVTLANNHIMDYGISGLLSTLQACEKNAIDHVGAGESNIKARQIFYTKIRNWIVAILNFAENEFSTTHGNYPGANPLDIIENCHDIYKAKENSDFVIVIVHGGHEMFDLPSPRIKNTYRFFAEAGASAIFGHHAHCYSGYELYKGVPIFYGLGNFIFDDPNIINSGWNSGFAVELSLDNAIKYNIIPYEQCGEKPGVRLLEGTKRILFFEHLSHLSTIISNDDLLKLEFGKYCKKVERLYLSYLEPHSIMPLHFLRNHKLFPSFLTKRKKNLYLNLIRCESHRDVILALLEKENSSVS